jgi:hypothetical protein
MGMRLGGARHREKNRQVKRRYDLMKALGQLESHPAAVVLVFRLGKRQRRSCDLFPPENL